jgi:hypothetical protein
MKHVKLFEEYIVESTKDNLVNQILSSLADDIQYLIGKHEEAFQKHYERPMTAYDKELTRLNIIWDMVKAIETYTAASDSLITVSSSISSKGNLEIFAQIQREDKVYSFNTEVIYAGGYNIQKLHYRYITKTNLPKTGNSQISNQYAEKIKKLSKLEKVNQDIQQFEAKLKDAQSKLQLNLAKSETQIWDEIKSKADHYEWPSWTEIIRRGADKNYNYSEEHYNKQKVEDGVRRLSFWKTMNIKGLENQIISYQKEISRLNKKLEQII